MNDKTNEFKQSYSLKEIADWTSDGSEVTLPAIQRGLVWKPNQVELLWDSILRGFPIGSFLLSDVVEEGGKGKYYLMDGQQRYNAISIGFNTVPDARAVLWIDIEPPEVKDSTRVYWIKATTIPHPWGFKNDDESTCLNAKEKREALEKFNLHGSIYNDSFSLKDTWPVESICPIPLYCLIDAAYETNDPDSFFEKACELFQKSDFAAYRKKTKITDKAKEYVMNRLYKAFSALKNYRINCNHLSKAVLNDETNNNTDQQTSLEVLFTRLNTGGTRISKDDLNYAAIKAYWPSIKEVNDHLAEKYMNPSKLVMLAFRLALTDEKDKELKNEISIKQIRSYAKDKEARDKIERLYNEGTLEKILKRIDDWLGVSPSLADDKLRTPAILRTLISWNSPDVYLLLMYFALKNLQTTIALTSEEIRSLAFGLHWFSINQRLCVQEIFKNCKNGINRKNIQMALATLMNTLNLLHIYSPEEVKKFIKEIKENKEWRVWNDIPNPKLEFFNRIFKYGDNYGQAEEILLYAEREYINTHFKNYDPARQDLWADYNRPWDFDHIVAQNRIEGKWGDYREYNKVWLNSIGNIGAISYESNRSKGAEKDFTEYEKNREPLLFDDRVENIKDYINYNNDNDSVLFAKITYDRFCRIYEKTYEMFKALFEDTVLSETLQRRKELMTEIANHYQSEGDKVKKHFAGDDDDYLLIREQDWAREWTGVGIQYKDYMVCFEWKGQMENDKPIGAEVGIRKSLGTKVTKDNWERLPEKKLDGDSLNDWWYVWDDDFPSIDKDIIIEIMEHYRKIIKNL